MSFIGKILLNNNESRFYTGQTINGTVEIYSEYNAPIQDISVMFEGQINVEWEEMDKERRHGLIIYFMQHFERKEYCVQKKINLQHCSYLQQDLNVFQFSCYIPENLPSSVATPTGYVNYELVLLLQDIKDCQRLATKRINVQMYRNIYDNPRNLLPQTKQYTKLCYWWSCKAKPIHVWATLPSTVFLPGDTMTYSLKITNRTSHFDIKRLTGFLIQTIEYKSLKPKIVTKTDLITLDSAFYTDPCSHKSSNFIQHSVKLPTNLPTSCGEPSAIVIDYKFQVLVIMKGFHLVGTIIMPITIGSHRELLKSDVKDPDSIGIENVPELITDLEPQIKECFDEQHLIETIV